MGKILISAIMVAGLSLNTTCNTRTNDPPNYEHLPIIQYRLENGEYIIHYEGGFYEKRDRAGHLILTTT
jgi:hypothetical protein